MSEPTPSTSTLAKTARGTAWVVAWRMGTRTLGVISTLFLVRLLLPSEFGLLALALSFTQSVEALSWFGIEDALVREKDPQRSLYDTAFTMQLIRAVALTLLIMAAARPAAEFFKEPRLAVVVFALVSAIDYFLDLARAKMAGSPPFSRTTRSPASAASTISRSMLD